MTFSFLRQLQSSLQAFPLQNRKLLVAVSGGADSIALLRGLHRLQQTGQYRLIAAHLNHQLRGEESDDDLEWVRAECLKLNLTCITEQQDIAACASKSQTGIEEEARRARYEFLTRTARKEHCEFVAVAHHADDQIETVLHHILRGTGISGLAGMPRTRPLAADIQLIRPLLQIRKRDIEKYLREIGQPVRHDVSNTWNTFTRNRIRNELLPLLEEKYNSNVREAIVRLSQQAHELQEALSIEAKRHLQKAICDNTPEIVRLSRTCLSSLPQHLQRECFVELWRSKGWPRQRMGFEAWNRLAESIDTLQPHTFPGGIHLSHCDNLILLRKE